MRPSLPALERAVFFDTDEWSELAAHPIDADGLAGRVAGLDFDDPINIQYTSGTTGFPKGATLTHHNILNNAHFVAGLLDYTEADRVCIPVPLYHCFGMVMGNLGATNYGAAMVYPGGDVRSRGDAARLRRGALHEPLRRPDDVHRPARAPERSASSISAHCAPASWPARRARPR